MKTYPVIGRIDVNFLFNEGWRAWNVERLCEEYSCHMEELIPLADDLSRMQFGLTVEGMEA